MRFQTLGDKADFFSARVKNKAGAEIVKGTPVCLLLNGTDDGLAVTVPSGGDALAAAFFFGVLRDTVADNAFGEAQVYGLCRTTVIRRATRAATTDSWASQASIATAVLLKLDTVNDAFSTAASTVAVDSEVDTTLTLITHAYALLAESLASYASSASATSDSRTAITVSAKTFIRAL